MSGVTYEEARRETRALPSALARAALGGRPPGAVLTPAELLRLLVADQLRLQTRLADLEVAEAVYGLAPALDGHAEALDGAVRSGWREGRSVPPFLVTVADGRYAACTDRAGFHDAREGEDVDELPAPPLCVVSVDVNVLYGRAVSRLRPAAQEA